MAHTLYLTADEKKIFDTLDKKVTTGASIEMETQTFEDTNEKRAIRMRNLTVQNPSLQKLQLEMQTGQFTENELATKAESLDLNSLSQDDVMELAFAWGPDVFSTMIQAGLPAAVSQDDLESLAQMAAIRHGLLLAMNR